MLKSDMERWLDEKIAGVDQDLKSKSGGTIRQCQQNTGIGIGR